MQTIGMTYDLKDDYLKEGYTKEEAAEFDQLATIDAIDESLQKLGYKTERIGHAKKLVDALSRGKRWDFVFNIAECLYGFGRESTVPCLLDLYQIPYTFSDPAVTSVCLHKGFTKQIIRCLNVRTADFFVVKTEKDFDHITIPFPLFIKPVSEGTGKGISEKSIIYDKKSLYDHGKYLLDTFKQPVLVEEYLPGEEFTVGMSGTGDDAKVLGIMTVNFGKEAYGNIYSYKNKSEYEGRLNYALLKNPQLEQKINDLCLAAWRGLGCQDMGRIDVRLDKSNEPCFIEVNPLAGLHPVDSDLIILAKLQSLSYLDIIQMIIESAKKRL